MARQLEADKAAEKIASYDSRLAGIDTRRAVLTWMAGTSLALTAGALWRLLSF